MVANFNGNNEYFCYGSHIFNGNAEYVRITSNGNVGIGTTNPQRKLHVDTALRVGGSGAVIDFGDSTTCQIYRPTTLQEIRLATNSVDRLIIGSSGNLGIGTTSPTATLDVFGGILARATNTITNQVAHIQWNRSNGDGETWILNQKGGGNSNAGIRFGSATTTGSVTEWMRIIDNGNVGIGVTPSTTLHVNGGQNGTERCRIGSHFSIYEHATLSGPNVGASISFNSGYIGAIRSAGAGIALCDNGGNVGIGTTSPSFLLDVNGKSRFRNCASFNFTSSTIGSAGNQTWTVAIVESRLIVRSGLTGTTTDTMPALSSFTSAGYTTGDTIEFIVHNLSAQTYSLTSSGSQYNSMAVLTNVPKKFLIRLTASAVDIYAI